MTLGDQQAEHASGPQHPGQRVQRGDGVVDDFEDAVAEHQVDAAGTDHVQQAGQVALPSGDRDVALAGTPVEGRQGIGAGVDHGDPVAEPGDRDGQAAGARPPPPAPPRAAGRTTPRRYGWRSGSSRAGRPATVSRGARSRDLPWRPP